MMGTVYIMDDDQDFLEHLAKKRRQFTGADIKLKDVLHELIENGRKNSE